LAFEPDHGPEQDGRENSGRQDPYRHIVAPALRDQAVAGVIMWRSGAAVFLVTAVWLVVDALAHADRRAPPALEEDERSLATIAEEAQEEEEEVDEVEVEG